MTNIKTLTCLTREISDQNALIFLAGEAGVGKSTIAKKIQKSLKHCTIIDKDEATSVLVNSLLKSYGQPAFDRESAIYLEKVKPLEYLQLDSILKNGLINDTSAIICAPFFDNFFNAEWIQEMKDFSKEKDLLIYFIVVKAPPETIHERLISRNAVRDTFKLKYYSEYRAATDLILSNMKSLDFINVIDNS